MCVCVCTYPAHCKVNVTDKIPTQTYLTSCSTVLPEKLTVPQLLKKFPAFYGTRNFISKFKSACYLFPS